MSVLDIPTPALSMDQIAVTFFLFYLQRDKNDMHRMHIGNWINKVIQIDGRTETAKNIHR